MPEVALAPAAGAVRRRSVPARPLRGAAFCSVARAVPAQVITNAPIAERLGVSEDWIVSRTGVRRRHATAPGERLSDLAAEAGARALADAGLTGADVDLLLVATTTQDEVTPSAAPIVAERLGAQRAAAIDVGAACTAFLSGLALATAQLESGRSDTALLIGADVFFRYLDQDDRRTAALFGDGAGATVLTAVDGAGAVGPVALHSDGTAWDLIRVDSFERVIRMAGHETFRNAVTRMSEVTHEALAMAGLALDDIDLFVYHQANSRIIRAVGDRLGLPAEKVVDVVERYGNTSAASIPIALSEAREDGRLRDGARVLLGAFGAGFTWGAGVVTWGAEA